MKTNPNNILLGIGNRLRSDDGAGSFIAHNFDHRDWLVLDGKSAPENFTSIIKKIKPELLVMVDAVWMKIEAGSFRIIPFNTITALQLSTHSLPINLLIEYLSPYCQKIILIGIQPHNTQIGEYLSETVLKGCNLLIQQLKNRQIEKIQIL